ncbi:hypothetical protein H0H92_006413, partial [Tricholoma furcatifolium]
EPTDRFRLYQEFEAWLQASQHGSATAPSASASLSSSSHSLPQPASSSLLTTQPTAPPASVPLQSTLSSNQTASQTTSASAPILSVFPSSRLPALPSVPTASQSPFTGWSSLTTPIAGSTASSHANQARLASAQAVLPRRVALARRGNHRDSNAGAPSSSRRGRGPAIPAPSRVISQNRTNRRRNIDSCLAPNDPQTLRLQMPGQDRYFYHVDGAPVSQALRDLNLLFELDLSLQTPVSIFLSTVADELCNHHRFASTPSGAPVTSPLLLLYLRNRGNPRPSNGQITLGIYSIEQDMTLLSIAQDGQNFPPIRCIDSSSNRFILFPMDTQYGEDPGCQSGGDINYTTEEGELSSDSDSDHSMDNRNDTVSHAAAVATTPATTSNTTSRPLQAEVSMATAVVSSLPDSIWILESPWEPPSLSRSRQISFETLASSIYRQAGQGSNVSQSLRITGLTISDMAAQYLRIIDNCIKENDFRIILTSNRHFSRQDRSGAHGQGVENEVLQNLLEQYLSENTRDRYLVAYEQDLCSLQLMTSFTHVPQERLQDMKRFGVIIALSLVAGRLPHPISPALILFIIYDFDFRCLTPDFIGEWFPELRRDLLTWKELGPTGDPRTPELIARFSTYLNIHILQSFEGGPGHFLAVAGTCQVNSPEDLLPHIQVYGNHTMTQIMEQIQAAIGDTSVTFESLFMDFLRGQGVPCPDLFSEFCGNFDPVVDLSKLETPVFRCRMLLWAITGTSLLDPIDPGPIHIWPIIDNDAQYGTASMRNAMAREGVISFRTCFKTARFPATFILYLAQQTYTAE